MAPDTDLCIVGAGPAGMAAAATAAEAGLACTVLDEQPQAGGQIYRGVTRSSPARRKVLGKDYAAGRSLAEGLDSARISHVRGATVWRVERDGTVAYSRGGRGHVLRARRILLATGALERPVPIPGWTLPGVMTAGAGQILLKSAGLIPERCVLAGAGPLVYLLAQQLVAAGSPPAALVETQPRAAAPRAAGHLPRALKGWRPLAKGLGMIAAIRRAGVPRYLGASGLEALGTEKVEGLAFTAGGRRREIAAETLLLHQGVVPNTQITRALGCEHVWDGPQACFRPVIDAWGTSTVKSVKVAGDGGGIAGAEAAELEGRIAALGAAHELGALSRQARDAAAGPLRPALTRAYAVRPLLDALYAPPPEVLYPRDETVVCRCEEVTAGAIRRQAALGCQGPNQAKAMTRCGMGPCQGRYCGLTVTNLLSRETGRSPEAVGYYHIRAPLKPITVAELADLDGALDGVSEDAYQGAVQG